MIEPWPDAGWSPFRGAIATTWEGGMRVPGIAYWKDMITPGRQSDGLFDLSDLFLTSLALAGVDYRPPKDKYLDSVDQASFLLADGGISNRKYVYYWLQDVFSALRVAEYKFVMAGMSDDAWDVVNPGAARRWRTTRTLGSTICTWIPRNGTVTTAVRPSWTICSAIPGSHTRRRTRSIRRSRRTPVEPVRRRLKQVDQTHPASAGVGLEL